MSATLSPTPASPPSTYAWEATDEEIAARYDIPRNTILRFDLNTSAQPPMLAAEVLARGRFQPNLAEYPPSDYRALVAAAAAAYGVGPEAVLVAAGADEALDVVAKAFLPAGGTAVIPVPSYAMYRVLTEQRAARVLPVPRRLAADGWAIDLEATLDRAAGANLIWLCSPNNPTALAEPAGTIESLLARLGVGATRDGVRPPVVVVDEAYAEFTGRSLVALIGSHPNLVVVRTASKAYALAGLRVGFAVTAAQTIAELGRYRPPASVSTVSATVVTEALRDQATMLANVARVTRERERLSDALRALGWAVGASETNFILVDLGTEARASAVGDALLRRGIVPRTFGAGHPLAAFLRFTVRDEAGNDALVAAASEISKEVRR